MPQPYVLHYAPDNASLIIRLVLDELGQTVTTVLVDRRIQAQDSPAYRALNPNGLIPVLETPQGPLFETAAILLWLSDTHGAMAPDPDSPDRGAFLKWLFFCSNTMHADLRILFYPHLYAGPQPAAQTETSKMIQARLRRHLSHLEDLAATRPPFFTGESPGTLDYYVAAMMRWAQLYPKDGAKDWITTLEAPYLRSMLARLESRPAVARAVTAEGLGPAPFSAPTYPQPPEGSAL